MTDDDGDRAISLGNKAEAGAQLVAAEPVRSSRCGPRRRPRRRPSRRPSSAERRAGALARASRGCSSWRCECMAATGLRSRATSAARPGCSAPTRSTGRWARGTCRSQVASESRLVERNLRARAQAEAVDRPGRDWAAVSPTSAASRASRACTRSNTIWPRGACEACHQASPGLVSAAELLAVDQAVGRHGQACGGVSLSVASKSSRQSSTRSAEGSRRSPAVCEPRRGLPFHRSAAPKAYSESPCP
jgi:hypothetical protein